MLFDDFCTVRDAGQPGDVILSGGIRFDNVVVVDVLEESIVVKYGGYSSRQWTIPIAHIIAFSHVYNHVTASEYTEGTSTRTVYYTGAGSVEREKSALQSLQTRGELM